MGKKSRRESRRNRVPRQSYKDFQAVEEKRMRVAVVTYPKGLKENNSLAPDVELVRSAILYADEVELVSLTTTILAGMSQVADVGESALWDVLTSLDDSTISAISGGASLPDGWRDYLKLFPLLGDQRYLDIATNPEVLSTFGIDGLSPEVVDALTKLRALGPSYRQQVGKAVGDYRTSVEGMLERSGAAELVPAIEAGILKLSDSGLREDATGMDDTVEGFLDLLRKLLSDRKIRLLFDDKMGDLVRSIVDAGAMDMSELTLKHAGEAAVGSGLVARLPVFPLVPTDELLNLRRDLDDPLTRYRSAAARLGSRLSYRSIDPESVAEIDDIWQVEVEPALLEIRESLAEHGLVREVVRQVGADMKAVVTGTAGAVLCLVVAPATEVASWIPAAITGATAYGANLTASVVESRKSAFRDVRQRDLFYLYEVDRRFQAIR